MIERGHVVLQLIVTGSAGGKAARWLLNEEEQGWKEDATADICGFPCVFLHSG